MKDALWYCLALAWRGATFALPTLVIIGFAFGLSGWILETSQARYLAHLLVEAAGFPAVIEWPVAVFIVFAGCLGCGLLFEKTAWGHRLYQGYEGLVKKLIPFYEAITSIIKILREGKAVVFLKSEYRGSRSLGIVTLENETHAAVFIPTSPMPGTGWTVFSRKDEFIYTPLTVLRFLWITATCGVDSRELLELCARYDMSGGSSSVESAASNPASS